MPVIVNYTCKKCNAISHLGDFRMGSTEEELLRNITFPSERKKKCKHEWKEASLIGGFMGHVKNLFY